MPLMALSLPGNVQMIYDEFDKIANLDFLPKDEIYEYLFGKPLPEVSHGDIKDYMLKKAGFSKDDLFKSIFLVVVAFVALAFIIGLIVLLGRKCFWRMPKSVKKVYLSLRNKLMFNSVLRSLLQSYLPLCMSCMVSITHEGKAAGYILLTFLALCPFVVIFILKRQTVALGHPYLKQRIGTLYQNVETVGKSQALYFIPLFMIRRLIFAIMATTVNDPLVQTFAMMYASFALIAFYVVVWPMSDTINNVIQLCNEVFLFTCVHISLTFTDYTTDPEVRHQIGNVYLVFLGFNVSVNVLLILITIIIQARIAYLNRKSKKAALKAPAPAPAPAEQ